MINPEIDRKNNSVSCAAEIQAQFLYSKFFSGSLSEKTLIRFIEAQKVIRAGDMILPAERAATEEAFSTIIEKKLDVEAIEVALRVLYKKSFVTRKIQTLFFLVEAENRQNGYFFNLGKKDPLAIFKIGFSLFMSFVKFFKGVYLVWRHSLA